MVILIVLGILMTAFGIALFSGLLYGDSEKAGFAGIPLALVGFMLLISSAIVMGDRSAAQANINQDPKVGVVYIKGLGNMVKKCDGSTLVYSGDSTSNVIANSPECK